MRGLGLSRQRATRDGIHDRRELRAGKSDFLRILTERGYIHRDLGPRRHRRRGPGRPADHLCRLRLHGAPSSMSGTSCRS
ncbi:hypothetical protein ACU4GA_02425 [Methylobacterium oryzae CBMB20]